MGKSKFPIKICEITGKGGSCKKGFIAEMWVKIENEISKMKKVLKTGNIKMTAFPIKRNWKTVYSTPLSQCKTSPLRGIFL